MIHGLETAVFISRVLLVMAAVSTTAFPVLYLRSPWRGSWLGQAVMMLAATLCFAVWLRIVNTFFLEDLPRQLVLWLNVVIIAHIVIATTILTCVQWSYLKKGDRREEK